MAPRPHDVALARDAVTIAARVPKNATLESLLRANAISADLTSSLISAVGGVFNPRGLRANQAYRLTRTLDGLFREFQYEIDASRFLRVVSRNPRDDGQPQFDVVVESYPRDVTVEAVSAEITRERSSLVAAVGATGENVQLALLLADVFGGEVDFNSELQPGDRAEVLFERVKQNGEFAGYGDVTAAVLDNRGRRLTAVRFVGADGKPGWYDEHGQSLKRQFLKSPLRLEPDPRVTSRFSYRRLHPIFGDYRAHLGVDYGAAYGAPVVAVASGTVELAGWSGEAGRLVQIRHAGGYETLYLHLSAFAPGIRPGARVDQGQLIGHVGASGAATGPHLDYRVKKGGVYVNPLAELSRMPKGESIPADLSGAFARARDLALGDLRDRVSLASQTAIPRPRR
jgi:murein DD-endopeptidase MepM/ murein hydrolase activator NlpD